VNNNLGNIYRSRQEFIESIRYLEKAVLLKPDEPEPRYNLGIVYKKVKRNADAKETFSELIKIDSSYWDAYYEYALILLDEGDKPNAKTLLETLLARKPDYKKKNEVEKILLNL